jgi:hypothetical protein
MTFLTIVTRPHQKPKRPNVDFLVWMVDRLNREPLHLGITRQSLNKMWIAEKIR